MVRYYELRFFPRTNDDLKAAHEAHGTTQIGIMDTRRGEEFTTTMAVLAPTKPARCPICAGYEFVSIANGWRCLSCSLFVASRQNAEELDGASLDEAMLAIDGRHFGVFPNWNTLSVRLFGRPVHNGRVPVAYSVATLEVLALRVHRLVKHIRFGISPNGPFVGIPYLPYIFLETELPPIVAGDWLRSRLALGVITRVEEAAAVCGLCEDLAELVGEIVVIVDSEDPRVADDLARRIEGITHMRSDSGVQKITVVARTLNGDFAAQRNRIRELVVSPWIIQLDSDERPSKQLRNFLGSLIYDAERKARSVIGFSRRNLVDGTVSSYYPDFAYRLARREVCWDRPVHEHLVCRESKRMTFAGGDLIHYRTRDGLRRKNAQYETIVAGAGRPDDARIIETPFVDFWRYRPVAEAAADVVAPHAGHMP